MKAIDQLASLLEELGIEGQPRAQARLGGFLGQLAHDLSSPASAFPMELLAVRQSLDVLAGLTNVAEDEQARREIADLYDICQNLDDAQVRIARLLGALREVGAEWANADDSESAVRP